MYSALSPKNSLFVCRLTGYRAQHSHHFRRPGLLALWLLRPGKPPEVTRHSTRRRAGAASRLQSFCSQKGLRWTPRTSTAWASIREAGARHRVSDLGPSEGFSGIEIWEKHVCIFSTCLAKLWVSNVTCQCVWKADGLTCRWNTSCKMANFQECCMTLPVGSRIRPI